MLTLDQFAAKYSAKTPRPPIVLDSDRDWALSKPPAWFPEHLVGRAEPANDDFPEIVDDGGQLDCPPILLKPVVTLNDVVLKEIMRFEQHYNGQLKTYAEWSSLWRKDWWPKVNLREIFAEHVPASPPHPFWRIGNDEFERALEIGTSDEVAMWQRFRVAQFRPDDPRLAYIESRDRASVRARLLALAFEKFPVGVICLGSALFVHGLINQCPPEIWMWGEEAPPDLQGIRYFSSANATTIAKGTQIRQADGCTGPGILVTNPALSIVDCFSWTGSIGLLSAKKALELGILRNIVTPDELFKISDRREVAGPLIRIALDEIATRKGRRRAS